MKISVGMKDNIDVQLITNPSMRSNFKIGSIWEWEHWRDGKLIDSWKETNVCTAEGLNALLDIMFHEVAQLTTWYVLIFNTDTTPADGTTYATPVWTESTDYDQGTRPAYVEAAASGKNITNSASKAVFTISATTTIYGGALVAGGTDASTKGDAAGGGTLFCGSKFPASKNVVDNDVLNVTIGITVADT